MIHYSPVPFVYDPRRAYAQRSPAMKPTGLWLSIEEGAEPWGWQQWCRAEEWNVSGLAHQRRFMLREGANVLHLKDQAGLLAFTQEFREDKYGIDWTAVVQRHQGIVISPYQWPCRLMPGMTWYYGWDCASACIWDLAAVEAL